MQAFAKFKQAGHASPNRQARRLTAVPELADYKSKQACSQSKQQCLSWLMTSGKNIRVHDHMAKSR